MNRKGFTFAEVMVALALGSITLAMIVPAFATMLERSRYQGAVRQFVSDLRDARARAVASGWEYRIFGYTADASGAYANQYRMVARRSSATDWPDEDVTAFSSDTQRAGNWVDLTSSHPGVEFAASDSRFEITFDSRGTAPAADTTFNPVQVVGQHDATTAVRVSVVGGIRTE